MPTFTVTTPDGQRLKITGPEGTTREQALQQAKAHFYEKQAARISEESPAVIDPTRKMNWVQKFRAGMGKSIYDTGRGIGNLVGLVSDAEIAQAKELDAALMNTGAGMAGNIAGHIGQVLAPGGLLASGGKALNSARMVNAGRELMAPTSFGTGAGIGAGYNFLQPGTMQERLAGAGAGAAFGGLGGYLGGKIGIPRTPYEQQMAVNANPSAVVKGGGYQFGYVGDDAGRLSAGQRQAEQAGKALGFKTTPGQTSGSKALQQMEAKLESQPMTSGPFNAIKDHNQTRLNQIAARAIGEKSDDLSAPILEQARDRLGDVYKQVSDDIPRKIDTDEFLGFVSDIDDGLEGILDASITDDKLVARLWKLAEGGEATGKQLQQLASKLGYKAAKQMTTQGGDRDLGIALYKVKDYVDNLLESGLSDDALAAFREARSQYRNLMLLTQRNGVINPSSGNIAGNALAGLLQQKDRAGFLFNKNQSDLYNAARFAQAFRPIVGDSGTATRSLLPGLMEAAVSAPINVVSRAYLQYPEMVTYGAQGVAKSLPMMGLLGGGAVGREMY